MMHNNTLYRTKNTPRYVVWLLLFSFLNVLLISTLTSKTAQAVEPKLNTNNLSAKLIQADEIRWSNPQLFKKLLTELAQVQSEFTSEQRYQYQFLQGYSSTYHGEHNKANLLLTKLLGSDANNLLKFRANYTLISIAAAAKDWTKGLKHIAANKKLISTINNVGHYQDNLLTTITFYNQLKQFKLALSHIEKLEKEELSPVYTCFLKQFTLEAKLNLLELKSTDVKIDEAIEICNEAKNKIGVNIIRIHKAKLHLREQEPQKALVLIVPFENEINNTLSSPLITGMNNSIAKAYFQLSNLNNAEIYALKSLEANKSNAIIQQAVDSYKLLYQIAKLKNKMGLALSYHEKYSELDREHLEGEKAKHLAFQLAEHQNLEQESQIKLLNEKNNALAAEQVLAITKVKNIQLIITVMTFIIIVLTVLGVRLRQSHKRVKALSEYDPLTGIYNHRHFTHVAVSALKYCQSAKQDLSLIMFDLDHFKMVNDNFGHICGDWALRETIRVCENIGRKNDIFARLGGEEFCLLLTSCNIEAAVIRAEACRVAIENTITEESGNDFTITASFGVSDVKRSGFNLEKLLADADFAAYASKHAGRNRVTVFEPQEDESGKSLDNTWCIVS